MPANSRIDVRPSMLAAESVDSQDHTAAHYFRLLLSEAEATGREGNYAISAALVIRQAGIEVIAVGRNSVFAQRDPSGHAEMNAIRFAHRVGGTSNADSPGDLDEWVDRGLVCVRPAPHDQAESILYTTLEPCPMCTVCIITAGIDRVVIAAEDPPSGTLALERLETLPPIWSQLAKDQHLEVAFCQSKDSEDPDTYLPGPLHEQLIDTFLASRERLDRQLGDGGVLDIAAIWREAQRAGEQPR